MTETIIDKRQKVAVLGAPLLAASKRTRSTPFSPRVEAAGVQAYTVYNHMLLPAMFHSLEQDYHHLIEHVQIWDVSCERQVELKGPDAARLAQLMTPRDLGRIEIKQCAYAPLIDASGGIINDPVILKLADDHLWISIADSDVLLWAKGLAHGLGLAVEICEPDVNLLAIQGPKSDDLMAAVFGDVVRGIRFFRFEKLLFHGKYFIVARSGWSKQGGFEIYLERPDLALELWDALWQAGQEFNIAVGCPNLIERIESGLLSYGNDMTLADNPFQCGLEKYCHLDSNIEFIGRAALETIRADGISRKIRGVIFAENPGIACQQAWPIFNEGDQIGALSSMAYSPRFEAALGFAMIDKACWPTGTKVKIETPNGTYAGKIAELPFV